MTDWKSRLRGQDCPFDFRFDSRFDSRFDKPRHNIAESLLEVQTLSISTLYLERIQTYRGHCILVFDPRHACRIDELDAQEWQLMAADLYRAEKAIMHCFQPDHINIASIGQVVPHLHWHIVPRYESDPRWGGPIWMTTPEEMPQQFLGEAEYATLVAELKACF